jgi:hypothetical protein
LITNEYISSRITELKTIIADGVVKAEIRKRTWRVEQLQGLADDMLALRAARKILYGNQMGEGRWRMVATAAEEKQAVQDGFQHRAPEPELAADVWPKEMIHPGFPNGGATGMLVKDYRGKNAEQEIWKFDAALVSTINDTLKQAAIEEGQWTEKRSLSSAVGLSVIKARLNAGRDRIAAEKRAADEAAGKTIH